MCWKTFEIKFKKLRSNIWEKQDMEKQKVGTAHVLAPVIEFKDGTVPWFDDNKLLKTNRTGKSARGYEVISK